MIKLWQLIYWLVEDLIKWINLNNNLLQQLKNGQERATIIKKWDKETFIRFIR